jgi:hypothetical protein
MRQCVMRITVAAQNPWLDFSSRAAWPAKGLRVGDDRQTRREVMPLSRSGDMRSYMIHQHNAKASRNRFAARARRDPPPAGAAFLLASVILFAGLGLAFCGLAR